ncbi:MAG: hypothetical protein M3Q56_10405, partial [Bacteroidota bacterium]|nr:hypothetical protein [Bacteroidota bacterium]
YIGSFLSLIVFLLGTNPSNAQGCVAVRPMGCSSQGNSSSITKKEWQFGTTLRYYKSFRHYKGDVEQKERLEQNTEVINYAFSSDFNVAFGLTNRISVSANLPVIYYDRSSLYEHYGNSATANPDHKRFNTKASGIGDIRLSMNYSITNPSEDSKLKLIAGFGIKLPTGDANVQDEFHRLSIEKTDSTFIRPVDQSIQLGDGGVGFNLALQTNLILSPRSLLYFNGFYMFNPKNKNETLTRGGDPAKADPLTGYHSVADQYAARIGASYVVLPKYHISASLGGRIEGIPASDLIGDSEGFRRPGYIASVEPSITHSTSKTVLSLSVPYALYRNRIKSFSDKADPAGLRHGDAAFADYLINLSFVYRFAPGGEHKM